MKYKEIYNQTLSNINFKNYIIYGENINNGSFIGGLALSLQGNGNTLLNVGNAEYTHIGIGYGIALIGKKALYICKQLDFLLFGMDHFLSTNEIFKMSNCSGTFVMITAAQDQGYQGPQSSFTKVSALSNLLEFTTYTLNCINAFSAFKHSIDEAGIKLGILSQKLYNESLINISHEPINYAGYEVYGNPKVDNRLKIYAGGFSIEYLKRYLIEKKVDVNNILIINKYSNSISFFELHDIYGFNLILDDDDSKKIDYPSNIQAIFPENLENKSVRENSYEKKLKDSLDKLINGN